MQNNKNLGRLIWCCLIIAGLFLFTLYAAAEGNLSTAFNEIGSLLKSNLLNLLFLGIMSFIALHMIRKYLHKIDILTNEMTDNNDYQNQVLKDAYKRYLQDKDVIGRKITDYITVSLLNNTINKSLCEIIGSVMTGLGLLGTFIGLIVGLHGFSADPNQIESSISVLLEGIKTSFLTSIYGVVFSLFFNRIYRSAYTSMILAWESLSSDTSENNDPDTRLVNAAEQISVQFNSAMEKLSTDISRALDVSLKGFSQTASNAFASIHQANFENTNAVRSFLVDSSQQITGLFESVKQANSENKETVESFLSDLSQQTADAFAQVQQAQRQNTEMVQKLLADTGSGISQLNTSMSMVSEMNQRNAEELQKATLSLNETSDVLKDRNDALHGYVEKIHTYQQIINAEQDVFHQEMQEYIVSITSQQENVSSAITTLCGNIHGLVDRYEAQNQMITDLSSKMAAFEEQNTRLLEMLNSMKELSQNEVLARSGLDLSLKTVSAAMDKLSQTLPRKVIEAANDGRKQFEQAYQPLHDELEQTIKNFNAASQDFQEAYMQLERQMQSGLGTSFSQFDSSVSNIAKEFRLILAQIQGMTQNIPMQLNQELSRILDEKRKQREELYKRYHIGVTEEDVSEKTSAEGGNVNEEAEDSDADWA